MVQLVFFFPQPFLEKPSQTHPKAHLTIALAALNSIRLAWRLAMLTVTSPYYCLSFSLLVCPFLLLRIPSFFLSPSPSFSIPVIPSPDLHSQSPLCLMLNPNLKKTVQGTFWIWQATVMKRLVLFQGQLAASLASASGILGRDITFSSLWLLKSCLVYSWLLDRPPLSPALSAHAGAGGGGMKVRTSSPCPGMFLSQLPVPARALVRPLTPGHFL